jgi:hypothetical protein
MSRDKVDRFSEAVRQITESNGPLSNYFDWEIADAIQSLIDSAVAKEREECAMLVDSLAEPGMALGRGGSIQADAATRRICFDVSQRIRSR